MATGPEHYREAEALLRKADEWLDADHGWKGDLSQSERNAYRANDLGAAQVHATLALAAATALTTENPYWVDASVREGSGWEKVAAQ